MIQKIFTVFVVPHTEEATYSFKLPLWLFQFFCFLLAVLLLAFCFLLYRVAGLQGEAEKNELLLKTRYEQREELHQLTEKTEQILARVDELDKFTSAVLEEMEAALEEVDGDERVAEGSAYNPRVLEDRGSDQVLSRTEANLLVLNELLPRKTEAVESLKADAEEYKRR